jgi:hypothetical protein
MSITAASEFLLYRCLMLVCVAVDDSRALGRLHFDKSWINLANRSVSLILVNGFVFLR